MLDMGVRLVAQSQVGRVGRSRRIVPAGVIGARIAARRRGGVHGLVKEATMSYQLFRRRSNFCRCTVEAWVLIGVMCERQTFYGNDGRTVWAQAMRWVKDRLSSAA